MRLGTWAGLLTSVLVSVGCSDFLTAISSRPARTDKCPIDEGIVVPTFDLTPITVISGAGQFPVVTRFGRDVAVVYRGRGGHISIDGRLDVATSADGLSWRLRGVAAEGNTDFRNPAFGAVDGSLLLAYTSYDAFDALGVWQPARARLASFVKSSADTGASWSAPRALDVAPFEWSSPYGRVVAVGGELVMSLYGGFLPVYSDSGKPAARRSSFTFVIRSVDGGRTWTKPTTVSQGVAELALYALSANEIVGAQRDLGQHYLELVRWNRLTGRWIRECALTDPSELPGDFVSLPDHRILLVYGVRHAVRGVAGRLSRDGGRSWSRPFQLVRDGTEGDDLGYPSTVSLGDSLVTLYYLDGGSVDPSRGRTLREIRYAFPR